MDLNSRTLGQEMRHTFWRFPQDQLGRPQLLPAAAFLRRNWPLSMTVPCSSLASMPRRSCSCFVRLLRSRLFRGVGGVFRFPACRCAVCLVMLLRGFRQLFFFVFLLWRFLDPGKFSKNPYPLFRRLPPTGKLHREYLFDNGVKLLTAWKSESFKFIRNRRQRAPDRAPLMQVSANLGERAGISRFRQKVGHLIERQFFEESVGINGSLRLATDELFLSAERLFFKLKNRVCFGGPIACFRKNTPLLALFQTPENCQQHRCL